MVNNTGIIFDILFRRLVMAESYSMVAPHSKREATEDRIFKANKEAHEAVKLYGEDRVINASVGSILDDSGKLSVLPTVIDVLRNLRAEDYAEYAPIGGVPEFLEASKKAAFRERVPEGYIEAVATPGGTGGIRHTVWNYTEMGDTVLTADWYWGPYKTICEENGRILDTFELFDEDYRFNIKSFRDKTAEIAKKQGRVVILLNSPSNNPTGYNLTDDEWDMVIDVLKNIAKNNQYRVVLFIDIAYIDYAGPANDSRRFMTKLGNLPENILSIIGFSMSKSFTLYGMRSGAMIGISSNKDIAAEFRTTNQFSNRGVWSNGTRPAMILLSKIYSDRNLFEKVESEREVLKKMLSDRAESFKREAGAEGLVLTPYKSGFFISIPCSRPSDTVNRLKADNIFAVPMKKGIRFAVCSVSKDKCKRVPGRVIRAI